MDNAPIVALEIGTTKVRVIVAEPRDDDHLTIIGLGESASRGVRKSEVIDLDNAMSCVRTAISGAEDSSGVNIAAVHMLVSGGHIQSLVNRGAIPLVDGGEITREDVEHVMDTARAISLASERDILHTICQRFYIDDHHSVVNPVGMEGNKLAVDMLILHCVRTRLRNLVRVAKTIPLEVEDVAFSGLCAALAVLTPEEKENGAVVIDLGGGSSNYVAYADSAIAAAGSFGIGGDHLTNDLARGLRLTLAQAENLKEVAGSAVIDRAARAQKIELPAEGSTPARFVRRGDIEMITSARIEEIFRMVKAALDHEELLHHLGAGVVLTGGGAYLREAQALAANVFGLPCELGLPKDVSGLATAAAGPEYASPLGMLRYAQRTVRRDQQQRGGLGTLFGKIFGRA